MRPDLKRDRPANLAILAGIGSAIALTVALIALVVPTGMAGRGNPLYWLMMAPVALWAWAVVDFRPWALRLLPVVLVAVPPIAAVLAATRPPDAEADRITLWIVATLGLALGAAGWRWRARSGLRPGGSRPR